MLVKILYCEKCDNIKLKDAIKVDIKCRCCDRLPVYRAEIEIEEVKG